MNLGLQDKVAFVSGSSKGMGKAAATQFAEEGCKVVITGRTKEHVEATVEEIKAATGNPEVIGVSADLITKEGVERAVRTAVERWGTVDIAVSNVYGPPSQGKPFEEVTEEEWFQAYQQQVMHVVYVTAAVLPYMKKNRWGRLINISSTSAKEPPREAMLITGTTVRPAVIGLQKSLSYELAEYGITVNNVIPGSVDTDRLRREKQTLTDYRGKISIAQLDNIPMKRLGRPDEIGSVIVLLASERSSYVTGVTVQVDGGRIKSLF